jgi:hypothetical protein
MAARHNGIATHGRGIRLARRKMLLEAYDSARVSETTLYPYEVIK